MDRMSGTVKDRPLTKAVKGKDPLTQGKRLGVTGPLALCFPAQDTWLPGGLCGSDPLLCPQLGLGFPHCLGATAPADFSAPMKAENRALLSPVRAVTLCWPWGALGAAARSWW